MNEQQEQFLAWLKDGLSEAYNQEITDDQLLGYLQTEEGQQMANALYQVWQQNPDIAFEEAVAYIQQGQQQVQSAKFGAKLNYLRILKGQCPQGYEIGYFKTGGRICKKCVKKQEGGSVENNNNTGEAAIKEFKRGHKMKRCAVGGATDSKEMNVSCPCHKKKVSKKEGGGGTKITVADNHLKHNRNSEYYKKSLNVKKRQDGGDLDNKNYNDKFMSYSAFTPNSGLTTLTDLFKDYYM